MNLPKDPFMLYSVINMKMRDEGMDFENLCLREDLDASAIESALYKAGFIYDPTTRQFNAK